MLTPFTDPKLGTFKSKGYGPKGHRKWSNTYYNHFYHKGKHYPIATGTADPDEAKKIAKKKQAEITGKVARHEPVGSEANKIRAEHLKELRLKFVNDNCPENLCRIKELWNHLLHEDYGFVGWSVKDISALDLDRYTSKRQEMGASSETIRKEMGDLKGAFKLAIEKRLLSPYLIPVFPKLARSKPRQGFFKEVDVQSIKGHIKNQVIWWVVLFASLTGWRRSEIVGKKGIPGMKWNQVDFTAGEVRLFRSKNGGGRIFPFMVLPELKELMEDLRRYTDEVQQRTGSIVPWVFHQEGMPVGEFRKSWKSACKKAGVPERLFHDFRRTAVRNLIRAGVPAKIAMQLTGHKTREVFERYNITEEGEDLANAVARLAEYRERQQEAASKEKEKIAVGSFGN